MNSPSNRVPLISIIVPCYKDVDCLAEMYRRITKTINDIENCDFEIIYINDDSPDGAEEILNNFAKTASNFKVFHHSRNFGLMAVYDTGLRKAKGDCVVLMDGDLQDPPEIIADFYQAWREGYKVAYGVAEKRDESWHRVICFKLFYKVWSRLSPIEIPRDAGDFSLLDREVVSALNELPEKDRFFRGLRAWVGYRQKGIPFKRDKRFDGESTQNIFSYIGWATLAITSFSYVPLRVISFLSLIATGCSLLWFFTHLIMFIFGIRGPDGLMMLASLILLLGSCTLFSLSVIAEYLIRIFTEIKKRPTSLLKPSLEE